MRQLVDMDELWSDATEMADARLQDYVNRLPRTLPTRCPLSFEEIRDNNVDWDSVVEKLGSPNRDSGPESS